MKFLWRLKQEFKSNKLSSLLIAPELAFAMICLAVCISLSGSFISSVLYFSDRYDDNSSIVVFKKSVETPLDDLLSCDTVGSAVYVQYYVAQREDGTSQYIGAYSASAFEELDLPHKGDMVDINKSYGEAMPCMLSKGLEKEYPVGKVFTLNGQKFYATGILTDDKLYWMTSNLTHDNFIMCYDEYGVLERTAEANGMRISNSKCAFVTAKDGVSDIVMNQQLQKLSSVNAVATFDWRSKMSDDFDRMSGNLITGVLVLILSTVGFLSNILLGIRDNEKAYMCQRYFGQSAGGTMLITAARILVLLAIAAVASFIFFRYTSSADKSDFGSFELMLSIGITAAMALMSSTAAGLRLHTYINSE